MNILGIETSCDDTSVAIVKDGKEILFHAISSQAEFHNKYGGVVPEQAARQHLEKLPVLVEEALKKEIKIDAIAVTSTPGLAPALLVGVAYAKGLAISMNIPLVYVDHLKAHVYSNTMSYPDEIIFPHLCLLVSGGHTQLIIVENKKSFKIIGTTLDDAAGEAFDKVARMFNLGYPGGPLIEKMALNGNPIHQFPRPMMHSKNYDFSFSGIKTAVKTYIEKNPNAKPANTIASFQEAVVEILMLKTFKAAIEEDIKMITIAGGVSMNKALREKFTKIGDHEGIKVLFPPKELCGDNAAMIAGFGFISLNS